MPNSRDESRKGHYPQTTPKPASLMYAVGAGSDPGKRKKRNEDSLLAASSLYNAHPSSLPFGLFIVADGLGAYVNGQDASSRAIQAMVDCIWPKMIRNPTLRPRACTALLREAVQRANTEVCQQNIDLHSRPGTDIDVGVSATITATMIVGSTAYVANVGNCRTYLYNAHQGLKQVTTDHSAAARLVAEGKLAPDDLYNTRRFSNQVTRALFNKPRVEIDHFTLPLHLGDTLLLCSYGLWSVLPDPRIEDLISHAPSNPSGTAEALIQAALDAGGSWNISVIVVSLLEAQDQTPVPGMQLFAIPETIHLPEV